MAQQHSLWERQPARIVEAVRAVLLAAVALGAVALDDAQVAAITTAIAAVLSIFATEIVKSKVYAPATVEDMGALDPAEDQYSTEPDDHI